MLCIGWGRRCVTYYELLKPPETINFQHYRLQLTRLKQAIQEKRSELRTRYEKLILQHDNAGPHVGQPVRIHLERAKWEVLPQSPYSLDTAPSDKHLFRLMQSALTVERFA
ncbi:hypothetical protein Trydic_g8893 [Trypoxylus dichotomus]